MFGAPAPTPFGQPAGGAAPFGSPAPAPAAGGFGGFGSPAPAAPAPGGFGGFGSPGRCNVMQAFSFAFVCDHFLTQNRIHYKGSLLIVALVDVRFQSQPTSLFLSCHHWCNSLLCSFLMFAQPPLRPLPGSAALALRLLPPPPLGSAASGRLPQHPRRLVLLLPPQRELLLCHVCMHGTDEKFMLCTEILLT